MRCVVQECVMWSNYSSVHYNYGVYTDERFPDDIDYDSLKEMGIVKKQLCGIKVLGNGVLEKKLVVKASKFSKTAKEQIEKLGGKAEVI